jgi:hypothetical protein
MTVYLSVVIILLPSHLHISHPTAKKERRRCIGTIGIGILLLREPMHGRTHLPLELLKAAKLSCHSLLHNQHIIIGVNKAVCSCGHDEGFIWELLAEVAEDGFYR